MLAGLYLTHDKAKAITAYANIVETQPKNVVVNNNLAWLYLEQGKVEEALIYAKRAFELAPEIANVSDTYAKVLLETGEKELALKYAAKANALTKGKDVDIALNYIQILIANNNANEAKVLLEKTKAKTPEQKKRKAELSTKL